MITMKRQLGLQPALCLILLAGQLAVEISGYVLDGGQKGRKKVSEDTVPLKTNEEEGSVQGVGRGDRLIGEHERVTNRRNDSIFKWVDRLRPPRFQGHLQIGPGLMFNVSSGLDWNPDGSGGWMKGENVCVKTEKVEEEDEVKRDTRRRGQGDHQGGQGHGWPIQHHRLMISHTCDNTDSSYKCTTRRSANGKTTTTIVTHECCPGFEREDEQSDCTKAVQKVDVISTLEHLTATEAVRALSLTELTNHIQQGQYTVFAPTNEAFEKYSHNNANLNVVVVSSQLESLTDRLREVMTSHLSPGLMKISALEDDELIGTELMNARIRINKYNLRSKQSQLVTANCAPLKRTDVKATNGLIHLVEGVLEPAVHTLKQLVLNNPKLSMFSKVLANVDLVEGGHYTLFAPTDDAFERLSPRLRDKILNGHGCVNEIVKEHVLPNVICSSAIQGRVRTRNILDHYVRMSRTDSDELEVESCKFVQRDLMATNGVLHILDKVIITPSAEDILMTVDRVGSTQFLKLLSTVGLDAKLQDMNNFTLFLPTNDAVKDMAKVNIDSPVGGEGGGASSELERILSYHIVPKRLLNRDLFDGQLISTTNGQSVIPVKEYISFPFNLNSQKTVQCAPIIGEEIEVCGGVVHVINKVIHPPSGDVLSLLQRNADYSQLMALIQSAGLTDMMKGQKQFTFFAPTNRAFDALPRDVLSQLTSDVSKAKKVLLSHIISDTLCCAGVFPSGLFTTHVTNQDRWMLTLYKTNGVVMYGTVPVHSCDFTTTNGVVHSVDRFVPAAISRYTTSTSTTNSRGRGRYVRPKFDFDDFWSIFD